MHVKKGDHVLVISGAHRGKQGKVLRVFPEKDRVIIEAVNLVKRHTKAGRKGQQQGGIVEKEAPIHVSNVKKV